MFEWQTMLSPKDLPTPSCSDLYLTSHNRAVGSVFHAHTTLSSSPYLLGFILFVYYLYRVRMWGWVEWYIVMLVHGTSV